MLKFLVTKFRSDGSDRLKDIFEKQVPTQLKAIVVVTDLPLKPDQLIEVFRLRERLWKTSGLFLKKKVIIKVAEVDETNIGKGRNLGNFRG